MVNPNIQIIDDEEKVNVMKLIDLVEKENDFCNIRLNGDEGLFQTFVNVSLIHFTGALSWKWKSYNSVISEIFTTSDEALAMLMLENNIRDLRLIYNYQRKLLRKESKPKYTKSCIDQSGNNDKFQGWHQKGIKRFNEIFNCVSNNRKLDLCRDRELSIQQYYKHFCDKDDNSLDDVSNAIDSVTESDELDYYEDAVDEFGGEESMPALSHNSNTAN